MLNVFEQLVGYGCQRDWSRSSVPQLSRVARFFWVCDRSGQVGEWRCPHCRRYAFDDQMFGVARDGSPDGVGERHDLEPVSCLVAVLERWVPPRTVVRIVQNSWLYVPLLLDGAGLLPESAAGGWHSHPLSERW